MITDCMMPFIYNFWDDKIIKMESRVEVAKGEGQGGGTERRRMARKEKPEGSCGDGNVLISTLSTSTSCLRYWEN